MDVICQCFPVVLPWEHLFCQFSPSFKHSIVSLTKKSKWLGDSQQLGIICVREYGFLKKTICVREYDFLKKTICVTEYGTVLYFQLYVLIHQAILHLDTVTC